MKRFLLLIVMGFITTQFLNAQVIEIIGKGVHEVNPSTLTISDPGSVEKVVVVAVAIFRDSIQPADVQFSDNNENYTAAFNPTPIKLAQPFILNDPTQKFGYYTATFNTVDADGEITMENFGQQSQITSFTAYVYRTGADPGVYSEVKGDHAFLFRLGSGFPVVHNFTIPASAQTRNVSVTVPVTDLEDGELRWATVIVSAGETTLTSEFNANNAGTFLHLETITIPNVPGNVTEITVTIYSPNLAIDGKSGDSFITGPVVLSSQNIGEGCTLTQGYWKTHSTYGPAKNADETWDLIGPDAPFFLSGKTYIEVLKSSPKGNVYYILAHQYIAAELNFLAGANPEDAIDAFEKAKVLFQTYTPDEIYDLEGMEGKKLKNYFVGLAGTLDEYNNGIIGPGHCDEENDNDKDCRNYEDNHHNNKKDGNKSGHIFKTQVSPNPVKRHASVSFIPVYDGKATVELYNSMGDRKARLYNQKVQKGKSVSFNFNANQYHEGLYMVVITNGTQKESTTIKITR